MSTRGSAAAGDPGSRRVLVVDDDDVIRQTVAEVLDDEGFEVLTATNGAEALDQVRQHQPKVVILDLMMPVMNGWQFLEQCSREELCADTPVLVMSAYDGLARTAPQLGASACIAKPFDLEVLIGAVERLAVRGGS